MAILLEYEYNEMYGHTRFFKADRCINNESIRLFNQNKINANEIVSFDCGLFELEEIRDYHNEYVTDQILLIMVRPDSERIDKYTVPDIETFEFCGYDLVEMSTYISAITNCGAEFDNIIDYGKLSEFGLIPDYLEAVQTQILLRDNYPDENHAHCEVVEVWRKLLVR